MFSDPASFHVMLAVVGFVAGAIASVSGFGIVSLLTPLLAVRVGTKLAVAAVSVPHLTAIALRFWLLRILLKSSFWSMAHEASTDGSMLLGSIFLLVVGAGVWSLDAKLTRNMNGRSG